MKVLWVAHSHAPDPGGIATHGRLLAPALRAAGVDLHVWSLRDREAEEVVDGVPVRRFKTGVHVSANDGAAILRERATLARLLDELQPDVVHAHGPDPMVGLVQTLPRARRGANVFTLHTPETLAEQGAGVRGLLQAADVVVAVSEQQRQTLLAAAPELALSTVALPNCVPERPAAGPPPEAPIVLAGGRLSHQKGLDVLLDAWVLVRRRRPDARLVLVGDGELADELAAQCRRLGLDDVVSFVGPQQPEEVQRLLADARFFVMPSRFEGMPYFALEAAMAERAVVGTTVGGLDEVVRHGETGVLVPPEQPDPLAEAIVDLLDEPERAAALAQEARRRVRQQHGLDEAVKALLAVYRRAVTPRPRPKVLSVVIPTFEAERWVGEAVQSATTQALPPGYEVEVVVVDDGSQDGTLAAARAASPDVTVVRHCHSLAGGARNTGLALATGELVAFLDADDRWPHERSCALIEALGREPSTLAAFGVAREFGGGEGVHARPEPMATRMPNTGLFRWDAVVRTGGWLLGRSGEAVDWIARFLATDPAFVRVDQVTIERRVHGDNTGRGVHAQRNRLASLKDHLDRHRATTDDADPEGSGHGSAG